MSHILRQLYPKFKEIDKRYVEEIQEGNDIQRLMRENKAMIKNLKKCLISLDIMDELYRIKDSLQKRKREIGITNSVRNKMKRRISCMIHPELIYVNHLFATICNKDSQKKIRKIKNDRRNKTHCICNSTYFTSGNYKEFIKKHEMLLKLWNSKLGQLVRRNSYL